MALQIIRNTTGYVNPEVAVADTGWTISGIYAIHTSCNAGFIRSLGTLGLVVGQQYKFTYTVDNYVSGSVQPFAGSTGGTSRNAAGTYSDTLLVTDTAQLSFFSDGALRLSILSFYNVNAGNHEGITITFHEASNTWGSERSYNSELMINFMDKFFAIDNGNLWQQDVNPIRNNFFGVQYSSVIRFFVNLNATTVKMLYSMREKSNKLWTAENDGDITILPSEDFPEGMRSRLKQERFTQLYGDWFADFLRNLDDPRFTDSKLALLRGQELMGSVIDITLTNSDTAEVILFEVDVKSSPMNYTY